METFVICCSYRPDKVIDQLQKQGCYVCGSMDVPFWNVWKQQVSVQHAIVYQAETEATDIEILT